MGKPTTFLALCGCLWAATALLSFGCGGGNSDHADTADDAWTPVAADTEASDTRAADSKAIDTSDPTLDGGDEDGVTPDGGETPDGGDARDAQPDGGGAVSACCVDRTCYNVTVEECREADGVYMEGHICGEAVC